MFTPRVQHRPISASSSKSPFNLSFAKITWNFEGFVSMLFSLHHWTIHRACSCNRALISSMCMYAMNWIAYLNQHIYTICSLSVKFKYYKLQVHAARGSAQAPCQGWPGLPHSPVSLSPERWLF